MSVRPNRAIVFHSTGWLTRTPCSASAQARNSAKVASAPVATRARNAIFLVRGRPSDQLPRPGLELAGVARPWDDARVVPLDERVRTVVATMSKTTVDQLQVDADGDIAIRSGSAMVFVRITDDPPLVEVSSPVLTEVRATQRLYERLSALTKTLPVGRLYLEDDTVWASVGVFGTDFQPTHLSTAIRVMTGLADVLDDRLQGDFGGKVFFGEALPERREPGSQGERTGMYL